MNIESPAKLNLFLQVTGKRTDGYHNLFSLMCCIGLRDAIRLDFGGKGIRVTCSSTDVPTDETNLAWQAADRFYSCVSAAGNVHIHIEKTIPVGAGLGGGSSNAAAVLNGLNRHCGSPLTLSQLIALGRSIGADVPFFISGKPAIATGVGERLERFDKIAPFKVVLVYPGVAVSTAEVFKNLNLGLTNCEKKLRYTLLKQQGFRVPAYLCNDLEPVTAKMYPVIYRIKEMLQRGGAAGALMTGSGSSVFGLFEDPASAATASLELSETVHWQVFLTDLIL